MKQDLWRSRMIKTQQDVRFRFGNFAIHKSIDKFSRVPQASPAADEVRPLTCKLKYRCEKCTGSPDCNRDPNCRDCVRLMIQIMERATTQRLKKWRQVTLKKNKRSKVDLATPIFREVTHQRLVQRVQRSKKQTKFTFRATKSFPSTFGRRKVVENVGTGSHFFLSVLAPSD